LGIRARDAHTLEVTLLDEVRDGDLEGGGEWLEVEVDFEVVTSVEVEGDEGSGEEPVAGGPAREEAGGEVEEGVAPAVVGGGNDVVAVDLGSLQNRSQRRVSDDTRNGSSGKFLQWDDGGNKDLSSCCHHTVTTVGEVTRGIGSAGVFRGLQGTNDEVAEGIGEGGGGGLVGVAGDIDQAKSDSGVSVDGFHLESSSTFSGALDEVFGELAFSIATAWSAILWTVAAVLVYFTEVVSANTVTGGAFAAVTWAGFTTFILLWFTNSITTARRSIVVASDLTRATFSV